MRDFFSQSGLRFLALANLSTLEYGIILYILDAYSKGVDPLIISMEELAQIFSVENLDIEKALQMLSEFHMIDYKGQQKAYRIDFNPDFFSWMTPMMPPQATILNLPSSESGYGSLTLLSQDQSPAQTVKRVLEWFFKHRPVPSDFLWHQEEVYAKKLVQDQTVDQILLMIDYFKEQIASLESLHKNWHRFFDQFDKDNQKIDFFSAKRKQEELDQFVREQAKKQLDHPDSKIFSSEESHVLKVLIQHRHPRKQLFWAYQLRSRYQNLMNFFEENAPYMLSP